MKNQTNFTGLRIQGLLRGLLVISVLLNALALPIQTPAVFASGSACATGSPASATYTITTCLTAPADGAVVSGDQNVSATFSTTGANPGVAKMIFYLNGQYLITDYNPTYGFILPTNRWVDGNQVLEVESLMKDGFTSPRASITLTFHNNVTQPPVNTNTFTPTSGTTPQAGQPFVLVAAGDGADGATNAGYVTDLINSWNPNLFLYLGDVYEKGTATEFYNWYGPASTFYGRFKPITDPIIGNHEYENGVAPGYFDYWNNVPNYYSYNAAGWHFIALNSNCGLTRDCAVGQAQYNWLQNDLNTHNNACTIAYFHHPVFNVGPEGYATSMNDMWALMASKGVDIVLTGHDHDYQRWLPLNGSGQQSASGMTEFVAGTGGHGIQNFITTDNRMAVGFDTSPFSFGALRFQLNQDGASYQYINYQGLVLDSGAIPCNGAPADVTSPSAPASLTASVYSATQADLAWPNASDNVGVAGYDVYRDGQLVASLGMLNSFRDGGLAMGATYSYQVKARDGAGNTSVFSPTATVTMPSVIFSDGFESGSASAWTSNTGLVVQTADRYSGIYAARATSPLGATVQTFASKTLATAQADLYYSTAFKVNSLGTTSAYIQRFRTGTNGAIMGVFVAGSTGKLGYRNDIAATSTTNGPVVSLNTWHQLQTHVQINGASSLVEIWFDGTRSSTLSKTDSLGVAPIGRLQLGDSSGTDVYDITLDEAAANTSFINTIDSQAPTTPNGLTANATAPNSVNLSWNAASDNLSVTGYDVLRNSAIVATVGAVTNYTDTQVSPAFTYQYQVRARDAAGNTSGYSTPPASVTTPADNTPPSISLTAPTDGLTVSGILQLSADALDDVAVDHVDFLVNGTVVDTEPESPYTFTWDTTSLPDGTLAVITARAVDTSTNATISNSRSVTINNAGGDAQPPTDPANFSAIAGGASRVDLSWNASSDNIAVTGYDIYRDGSLLTNVGPVTTYSDTSVAAGTTYQYQIQARDAAGNLSGLVTAAAVTVPALLFSDSFENGFAQWTNSGSSIQQQLVLEGANGVRATSSGSAASFATRILNPTQPDLYYTTWFKIVSQGGTSAYLQRFRTTANGAILGVFVSNTGKLGYRNDVAGTTTTSTTSVSQGAWHQLQTHTRINGASSQVDVWLDGNPVAALSKTEALGANLIGRVQLGDSQATDVYDTAFDEVSLDTSYIRPSTLPYTIIDSGPLGLVASSTADFSFSSNAAGATFECALDGVAFSACSSPQSFTALSDGPHTFAVRATYTLARLDQTPASHTWTVDTSAPTVSALSPTDTATDVGLGTSVNAFFSEPLNPASLTTTSFSLALQGSSTALPATVSYNTATNQAILVPAAALDYSSTYVASLKGGPGGLTDLVGNPLASDVVWSFTTVAPDTTPPSVSLTAPLEGATLSGTVTLTADASDNVGVDHVNFWNGATILGTSTTAPYSFDWNTSGLPNGPAVLAAQAVDARGNQAISTSVNVTIANDITPPSVPADLAGTASSGAQVDLTWTAATDDVAVTGYDIFRNGAPLDSIAALINYSDTSVVPSSTYQYQIRARDAAGNVSALSAPVSVSTPAGLFSDHFESGDLSRWNVVNGLIVQQQEVYAGAFAARATSSGPVANAYYDFGTAQYNLYYDIRFKVLTQDPASSVYVQRFKKADTLSALGVFVSPTGKLGYRNDIAGTSFTSTVNVSKGAWHSLQTHVSIDPAGGNGLVEMWFDGIQVMANTAAQSSGDGALLPPTNGSTQSPDPRLNPDVPLATLSRSEPLGNAPVARIQLGDSTVGRTYDIAFDNVSAAPFYLNPGDITPPSTPANFSATASSPIVVDLTWSASTDNVGVTGYDIFRNGSLAASLGAVTSFSDTGLTPATSYQYQIRARDAAENISPASALVSISTPVDTTPPVVSITAPTSGSVLAGTISLAASASDDVGLARVEFLVNGAIVNTTTTAPFGFDWDSKTVADGQVAITARAVDTSNNATVSAPVNLTVDNTPPDTSISSGPSALTNINSASFSLASNEANVTYACSLDGAAFGACVSPATYTGLLDGAHNFQVKATDQAGNVDSTPAVWNWTIDTIRPTVRSTTPARNSSNFPPVLPLTANFSEAINPATLTSATFFVKLNQTGSTAVAATVTYDPATNTASLKPTAALTALKSYIATIKSGVSGAKDLAGNSLSADYTWTFTTGVLDTIPPTVSISSPASNAKIKGQVTITANASDNVSVSTVEFLVNGNLVGTDTTSPFSFIWNSASLADGAAVISARATDTSLNKTTSAGVNVTVDNTPPDTSITSGPTGTVGSNSASFTFTSTETGSTFACKLDGAVFSACTSPASYSNLSSAAHTFQVRATDAAGNTDATPASQSWTVDATPPDTTITAGPTGSDKSSTASFSFTATKPGSTFTCSLDGPVFSACSSPVTYNSLANGSHTFQVRATDPIGNVDPTPASRTWTVDSTAPTGVAITTPSAGSTVTGNKVTISASASDNIGVTVVNFYLDGALMNTDNSAPFSITWNTNNVSKTTHNLFVRAFDAAGNMTQSSTITVTVR
jgi:chitodextrinase